MPEGPCTCQRHRDLHKASLWQVRTSGENDNFIKNAFDLRKCYLEQARDSEDRCYLETFVPTSLCDYAKAFELQIRKEGIRNVSVKVTP